MADEAGTVTPCISTHSIFSGSWMRPFPHSAPSSNNEPSDHSFDGEGDISLSKKEFFGCLGIVAAALIAFGVFLYGTVEPVRNSINHSFAELTKPALVQPDQPYHLWLPIVSRGNHLP